MTNEPTGGGIDSVCIIVLWGRTSAIPAANDFNFRERPTEVMLLYWAGGRLLYLGAYGIVPHLQASSASHL